MAIKLQNLPPADDAEVGLLPYYVYELRDPRDNSVFYVGKGKGNRVDAARDEGQPVGERICRIVEGGHEVKRIVIGRFRTEDEALAVESVLIKWNYGFDRLTNLIHGHRHRVIRAHAEQANGIYSHLSGIDRPRVSVRDGTYTREQLEKITNNQIVEKLESLRDALCDAFREGNYLNELTVSDPDLTRPQDPCLMISNPAHSAVQLQLKMQLTGKNVVLNLVPTSRDFLDDFKEALRSIKEPFLINKGNRFGVYSQNHNFHGNGLSNLRGVPHDNLQTIIDMILQTWRRLTPAIRDH